MALSVRTRFEIFKRDNFTCRYCGKQSPEVVLEVDHIAPKAEGGSDDTMNLATSCWACNSGKSCVPLGQVMTGEDPHDRAILILERERQLREYNEVLGITRTRVVAEAEELEHFLMQHGTRYARINDLDRSWLKRELEHTPKEIIRSAMEIATAKGKDSTLRFVGAILRNWRSDGKL